MVLVGCWGEESHLHSLDDLFVFDVVIYLAHGCRHANMGTVHFPSCGNYWWIFFRTALVESRIHSTSSLVLQDEEAKQKPIGHTLGMTSSVLAGCWAWYFPPRFLREAMLIPHCL